LTNRSIDADNPVVTSTLQVGLDVRMARASGIGTYIRGLRGQLRARDDLTLHEVEADVPIYSLREQVALPPLARGLDLFHAPHYNAPLAAPCPLVVTVHDLAHLALAHLFPSPLAQAYAHGMFRAVVTRARRLITDSFFTRAELRTHLGVDPDRVTVIHLGTDPRFTPGPTRGDHRRVRALGVRGRFVLYVGNVKPNKNVLGLVEAFSMLGSRAGQLVIAGRRDRFRYGVDDFGTALASSPARDRIVATGEVTFDDIRALYRTASVAVLPSLYEGFGLPVLEAMACGTPVVASDRASIPEVADDAALLVDATSRDQLAAAIERVLEDTALRHTLIERGRRRVADFSWARAAEAHVAVYREAAGKR